MPISNLDQEKGLVNGSRGIVTRFTDEGLPIVKFLNGVQEVIDYHQWEMENDNKIVGGVVQIPLKLAYATTIHKSQVLASSRTTSVSPTLNSLSAAASLRCP